jgi:hypothetical protein
MSAPTPDPYDDFLLRVAAEARLLEASVGADAARPGRLTYQAWSLALPERARHAIGPADAWQAGATAMFQALAERGYIAPGEVVTALASTLDVLTT